VNREQQNAIISLSRLPDWKPLMEYIAMAVHELEVNAMMLDPNDSVSLARIQGARQSLVNVLGLEESAHDMNKKEEDNE
jgi:hypothetical protein